MDGTETTRQLLSKAPDCKVLILTTFGTSDGITHAIEADAKGGEYLSPEVKRIISRDPPAAPLSPRQKEILESIVRGLSNPDIAKQLGISLDMVKEHIETLFQKIGAANRSEAVAIALRKHLLKI